MSIDGPALSDMAFALEMDDGDDATMFIDNLTLQTGVRFPVGKASFFCLHAAVMFGKCTCKQDPIPPPKFLGSKAPRSPSDANAASFESGLECMSRSARMLMLSMAKTRGQVMHP